MSRTSPTTSTIAEVALQAPSSTNIGDTQQFQNDIADTVGLVENDPTRKVYATNNYLTDGTSHKTGLESFDVVLDGHETRISNVEANNSQDITLAPVGTTPNSDGASLIGQQLNLEPADPTNPGVVTAGIQTFAGTKTFNDDVIVQGDLTVQGTTTTLNTATLEVEDQNILINNGGNDASSEGAGLEVERTGTNGSIKYENALASKWKLGALAAESEVIVAGIAQTFTKLKTWVSELNIPSILVRDETATFNAKLVLDKYDSTLVLNPSAMIGRRARGSFALPSAVLSGDALFAITARGYGTSSFSSTSGVRIMAEAAENFSNTANGTRWAFQTTPNGGTAIVTRLTLDEDGALNFHGNTSGILGIKPHATTTTHDYVLPQTQGAASTFLKNDGSGNLSWDAATAGTLDYSSLIQNLTMTGTVGASALTVAIKTKAGADATGGDPINIGFRNATAGTGDYFIRSISAALSMVISSGSTLGHVNGVAQYIFVYAIDNAGTVELALSSRKFDDGSLITTTAEGGAGAADSGTTIYSSTARTNVPLRYIGRLVSNQTTAGTWAAAPTEISLLPAHAPALSVQGVINGSSAAPFNIGEYFSGYSSGVSITSSATFVDITSITLTPGDWDISGFGILSFVGTSTGNSNIAVSAFSGNTVTDHIQGDNYATTTAASSSGGNWTMTIPAWRVSITTSTTYYLKGLATFVPGTVTALGRISARRVF